MANKEDLIFIQEAKNIIKLWCESHPTCDGCNERKEHKGCDFRGKTPREWK